jgi:hypothetical protein
MGRRMSPCPVPYATAYWETISAGKRWAILNSGYLKEWRLKHLERERSRSKQWRRDNPRLVKAQKRRRYERQKLDLRRENQEAKAEVLRHYGDTKCRCCGETATEFLTINHVNGGGTRHRNEAKLRGSSFYKWLVKHGFPSGYDVLCMNCNFALGRFGYCPHLKLAVAPPILQ